jgi:hypothetical protein
MAGLAALKDVDRTAGSRKAPADGEADDARADDGDARAVYGIRR